MQERLRKLLDMLSSIADRILEFVMGTEYTAKEAEVRIPEIHKLADAYLQRHRTPPSGLHCDRH